MTTHGVHKRTLWAVTLALTVYSVGQGLTYPLLAVLLDKAGLTALEIGLSAAMTPLGIVVSAGFVNGFAKRFGRGTLLITAILVTLTSIIALGVLSASWWWPVRFVQGCAINAVYIVAETTVNRLSPKASRGRILAAYTAITTIGYSLGPLALSLTGAEGPRPFLILTALLIASAAFVVLCRDKLDGSVGGRESPISMFVFVRAAPVLVLANGAAAFADTIAVNLLPIYGLSVGLSESSAVAAVSVLLLGGILLQYPAGMLSDKVRPLSVMFISCIGALVGLYLMVASGGRAFPFLAACFVFGGACLALQTAVLHELGDRFEGGMLAAGNAAFAALWGGLTVSGIPLSGFFMDEIGPSGVFLVPASLFAGTALMVAFSLARRRIE